MIKYNRLQIEDNKLLIDIEVENKPYYDNIIINGVRIDTPLTCGNKDDAYLIDTGENVTKYTKEFQIPDVKKELLLVTPIIQGYPLPDSPCGSDVVDVGVIYDERVLFDRGMQYLKELGDTCEISRNFIDFILKKHALDLSISTCNYIAAIKYWKMLTGIKGIALRGCGCNGR